MPEQDTKFSDLPVATSVASPDFVAVVQGGDSKQADVSLFGVGSSASVTFHSTGSVIDTGSFPFTADNAVIKMVDANDAPVLAIFTGGDADNSAGSLFIGDSLPVGCPGSQDNVALGFGSMQNMTADSQGNLAIGTGSLLNLTSGSGNIGIGYHAAQTVEDGIDNVAIGDTSDVLEASGVGITLVGGQVDSGVGVTTNATAIGYLTTVTSNNEVAIGNKNVTDAHFGFNDATGASNAILHGKGDAIVFPDSDPHVAGAAYWVLGVLTKSAG